MYDNIFFFPSRRRHTRCLSDWSSDVCSSDLPLDRSSRSTKLGDPGLVDRDERSNGSVEPVGVLADSGFESRLQLVEIGRASCRERVENWVGRVSTSNT